MSLIRMAILGAVGYWAWKQYMAGQREQGSERQHDRPSLWERQEDRGNVESGSAQLSGPGQGMRVAATDQSGGSTQHIVGRGVLR
jgi:hypothetical protein